MVKEMKIKIAASFFPAWRPHCDVCDAVTFPTEPCDKYNTAFKFTAHTQPKDVLLLH